MLNVFDYGILVMIFVVPMRVMMLMRMLFDELPVLHLGAVNPTSGSGPQ